MTTLTMRYIKGDFVVIGPDIQPTRFKTPNRDSGTGPAQARCAIGCHCKIKILDASEMLKDVLAVIVQHIDSTLRVSIGSRRRSRRVQKEAEGNRSSR